MTNKRLYIGDLNEFHERRQEFEGTMPYKNVKKTPRIQLCKTRMPTMMKRSTTKEKCCLNSIMNFIIHT